jgi:hypothetical protein
MLNVTIFHIGFQQGPPPSVGLGMTYFGLSFIFLCCGKEKDEKEGSC